MTEKLYLAPHVHLCVLGTSLVFLDLKVDKYITVPGDTVPALARCLDGLSNVLPGTPADESTATLADCSLKPLVDIGLLTYDLRAGKPAHPITLKPALRALVPGTGSCSRRTVHWRRAVIFLALCSYVCLYIKFRRLDLLVDYFNHMKANAKARIHYDDSDIESLWYSFRRFRTLVYTAHDACLFNALVLAHFLLRFGVSPTFVIGVRSTPFCAHAWVQVGSMVLDERLESTQKFTPILAV